MMELTIPEDIKVILKRQLEEIVSKYVRSEIAREKMMKEIFGD